MTTNASLPTGTVTFLFTDIEGSTRLVESLGPEEYGALLERHRAVLRGAFEEHGGVEVGTEGDSFFVVFDRPTAAVEAAVEGQRRLAAETWPPDALIRVRMGVHTGEGVLADGTYVGTDVNRAARIAAAGHGGQILLSATTSTLARDLPAGTRLHGLGEHRLKDLRPEQLCQLDVDGLPSEFPPIRSLDARPNNLPTQLTTFVGREHELAEAGALLERSRLLTLTGPGGTGKTRLALQLAATVADRYPGGVFFVALEPVRDPALVIPRIASAVGIHETGSRAPGDVLVEWLAERTVLLVLDNFEQVVSAGPVVADLLRAAATVSVIATSRAALHVSGEQEYPVPGLPVPPDPSQLGGFERVRLGGGRELDPATLEQYEAVRLFITRAVAVRPDFRVTNENAPAVAAICARLHGMPLAIELAAARVKILSPDAILTRLEHQLTLLASGARDLPARQQTLRGAIAWSYDILDDGLRRLLDRLSVFVGGCDLETAERVCGPADELGVDVLDGLMALADQSLVLATERGGEPRFDLLDTIREFAAEQLEARGEAPAIIARHAAAFVELAKNAVPNLAGTDQRRWLDRLEREHDNIRAVLDRSLATGDGATAIPLAFAMWRFWQKRGHLPEARRRLDAIAAQSWARNDPALWARLMEALGGVAWWQADLASMAGFYREALRVWRELGEPREIANAAYNASFEYVAAANPEDRQNLDPDGVGLRLLEEGRTLFAEVGDDVGVANTVWAIGNYQYFRAMGDHGAAQFREALEIFRRGGDRTMEAWSLHMLGSALLRTGDLDASRDATRHALRHFHEAGDAAGITLVLDDLSAVAVADGDLPRAARLRGAARNLTAETGAGLAGFIETWYEEGVRPSARQTMSREELERLGAEGAAMSLDEAVAYALEGDPASALEGDPASPPEPTDLH
ncbi:MAG TPA: adenylate/guanylate cyclase domain-containing protein [Candidatus Limnocylindrales bacterium]|nr:adenylate/guanylate cyclase domain-containing protein [Candidatus Limnocylindrales bacterium]